MMKNESEERLDRDPLAMRLSEMTFPPRPDLLVPDALAAVRERRGGRGRPLLRPATVLAAVLSATLLVTAVAWAPARAALSEVPGLGVLGALHGAAPSHPGTLAEATADGYTVRITGAYDDGTTVAISFAVSRSADPGTVLPDVWPYPYPTVTDSSGRQLRSTFTPVKEALTGSTIGYDRPLDGPAAGTPLAVDVTNLDHNGQITHGHWKMRLTIPPARSAQPLTVPSTGQLGGATISFQSLRVNDAYLYTAFTINGIASPVDPALRAKGQRVFPELYGPNGKKAVILNGSHEGFDPEVQTWRWQLADEPGTYRLVFRGEGDEQLVRTFEVPHGRGASVPKVLQP